MQNKKDSKKPKTTGYLSQEDISTWVEYLATGQVESELKAKRLKRLSQREVSLGDVSFIVEFMMKRTDGYISSLIEQNAVKDIVLAKMGATDEMWTEAKAEYAETLDAFRKRMEDAQKELAGEAKQEAE